MQIFKETGDSKYIAQKGLGKACFQHNDLWRSWQQDNNI